MSYTYWAGWERHRYVDAPPVAIPRRLQRHRPPFGPDRGFDAAADVGVRAVVQRDLEPIVQQVLADHDGLARVTAQAVRGSRTDILGEDLDAEVVVDAGDVDRRFDLLHGEHVHRRRDEDVTDHVADEVGDAQDADGAKGEDG